MRYSDYFPDDTPILRDLVTRVRPLSNKVACLRIGRRRISVPVRLASLHDASDRLRGRVGAHISQVKCSMLNDKVGVWIDHRKAVIVVVTPTDEHTVRIVSNVEKHLERSGDSPLKGGFEAAQVPADDRRQRALTGALNIYYDAVIAAVRDADALIILGPGEAKGQLKSRLVKQKLGARIGAVEAMDNATDRQIAAKVREYFAVAWSPKGPKTGRPNAGLRSKTPRGSPR